MGCWWSCSKVREVQEASEGLAYHRVGVEAIQAQGDLHVCDHIEEEGPVKMPLLLKAVVAERQLYRRRESRHTCRHTVVVEVFAAWYLERTGWVLAET